MQRINIHSQQGSILKGLAIVGAIIFFAFFIGCIAVANDGDDDGLGRQQLVSHEYCEENSDCYGGSYEQDYGSYDRNRNRDRNRGAFSPGPFDDSPVDAFNNTCLPGATCYYDGRHGSDAANNESGRRNEDGSGGGTDRPERPGPE